MQHVSLHTKTRNDRRVELVFTFILSIFVFASLISVAYAADKAGIPNPLKAEFSNVPNFIAAVLKAMVMIALPILTFALVYSGFLFVSARGKSGPLETAKNNFMYVIIGALLILGAWVIATLIGGTVTQLIGTDSPTTSVDPKSPWAK